MAKETKKETQRIVNESSMVMALRDHFSQPEWVLLTQVRNGVGFDQPARTADAIAMSVWPSRGLHLYGIEIKTHRNDWLRELKNPKKADDIAKYCDFWLLAVGHESIASPEELPHGWGLLVPGNKPGTLRMAVPPQRIENVQPMSRGFLASILKNVFGASVPMKEVEDEISRRVYEKVTADRAAMEAQVSKRLDPAGLLTRNRELEEFNKSFYEASGVWISGSIEQAKKLGRSLKLLQWPGLDGLLQKNIERSMAHVNELKEIVKSLPKEGE